MFLYTSGSTGTPEGRRALAPEPPLGGGDAARGQDLDRHRYLIAAPLYHMNALALAKLACAAHATIVLLPQFTARAYIEAIGRYRCTWLTAVPPMIAMMLREQRRCSPRTDLSSVEFVRMGSAPVSQSLMQAIRAALPQARRSPTPTARPRPGRWCSARIRRACRSRTCRSAIRIRRSRCAWSTATTATPMQGVLEMKCPAMMNGYHNRPDVRPPFTADGFYVTGDVFRRDADGFHYFVGRTDDMFVSGGENIYPADVERMLERHPDDRAGRGGADRRRDQGPEAGRLRHPQGRRTRSTRTTIKRFALANAPAYQHPRFVWFVDELPLASTNKVDRNALRRLAEERVARASR